MPLPRRQFLAYCSALGLADTLFPGALFAQAAEREAADEPITVETIEAAERLAGLSFTPEQRAMMVEDLVEAREDYEALRAVPMPNEVVPSLIFDPGVSGVVPPAGESRLAWTPPDVRRPASDDELAFLTVAELAGLLHNRRVTSTELTRLALARLERYDPVLKAVVTRTPERALAAAARADAEIAEGGWRGPLHGVPYGAKDLLAVRGYPTTWGATPYREQTIDRDAAVIERLDAAGAVLVAKLTLGALAWGDVWFGGQTRNPWNVEQGSSGSSAGPGSAVAAGLVPFAIGSETLGSIVSPSTRNGVTGHRPTFGLVSRDGAMALSWSMDKLGPMTRSALDCALVFDAIRGPDPRDPATKAAPFVFDPASPLAGLRVAYLADAFDADYAGRDDDRAVLDVLRGLGVDPQPFAFPDDVPVGPIVMMLNVEAAAAFDELTRTGGTDAMVRQGRNAWPHVFRTARMVPAVEYLQAARARTLLARRTAEAMEGVDVIVTPSYGGSSLAITNLTGHPSVTVPNAFAPLEDAPASPRREPRSITFIGALYRDDAPLRLAHAYQEATDFHRRRPPME